MLYKNNIDIRDGLGQPGHRLLIATDKAWRAG
jgi:hypothetical protein